MRRSKKLSIIIRPAPPFLLSPLFEQCGSDHQGSALHARRLLLPQIEFHKDACSHDQSDDPTCEKDDLTGAQTGSNRVMSNFSRIAD
jgi:hypothetical protein